MGRKSSKENPDSCAHEADEEKLSGCRVHCGRRFMGMTKSIQDHAWLVAEPFSQT